MSNQRAVIFDLDDTLYAESDYVKSGFLSVANWAAQHWNLEQEVVAGELDALRQSAPGRVFDTWLQQRALPVDSAQQMVEHYRAHTPKISPFPLVRETIEQLRNDYRIGLVSDGYLDAQTNKFDALAIDDLFDAVVFSDSLGRENWKPSRVPFDTVLKQLGIQSDRATYVGDNPTKDFLGARSAGLSSIRLRIEAGVYSHLEPESNAHAPDLEVTTWDEMVESIQSLLDR